MQPVKGKKRIRNVPILHNEVKKRHSVFLTDTAWIKLQSIAKSSKTSVSEIIEKLALGG